MKTTAKKPPRRTLEGESAFFRQYGRRLKVRARGDAIAGLIITFINVIGRHFDRHVMQEGLSFQEAGNVYTLLTIGDGLVSSNPRADRFDRRRYPGVSKSGVTGSADKALIVAIHRLSQGPGACPPR